MSSRATWGFIKETVRSTLRDSEQAPKYSDDRLLSLCRLALTELSWHTALATSVSVIASGTENVFEIPNNCIDSIERTGVIEYVSPQNPKPVYLEPTHRIPGTNRDTPSQNQTVIMMNFWDYPSGYVTTSFIPHENSVLTIYYFAAWPSPNEDLIRVETENPDPELDPIITWETSTGVTIDVNAVEMTIPRWMEEPLIYLIASKALDPIAVQTSDLNRWKRSPDSGNPEHNPLIKQIESFIKRARDLLYMRAAQDRTNFYRQGAGT